MDEQKTEQTNPPSHAAISNFEHVANRLDDDAKTCHVESVVFLSLAIFFLTLIAYVLVGLGDITAPRESIKPALVSIPQQLPLQAGPNGSIATCSGSEAAKDRMAIVLCQLLSKRDADIQNLTAQVNSLSQPADVRKEQYKRDLEFAKNNEQLALEERKIQGDLEIARQKMTFDREQQESYTRLVNNSIWRVLLILIGFFIVRHLLTRSRLAKDRERYLMEKAALIRLAKHDSSSAIWLVELLSGFKSDTDTTDDQELIDPSVKEAIKTVVPSVSK